MTLKIATDKWPFCNHIWSFSCQLHDYLSQNWDSDCHFEMLTQNAKDTNVCTPVKHFKMTVWTSVLWKMNTHLAKNGQKWSQNGHLWGTFISNQSLHIRETDFKKWNLNCAYLFWGTPRFIVCRTFYDS